MEESTRYSYIEHKRLEIPANRYSDQFINMLNHVIEFNQRKLLFIDPDVIDKVLQCGKIIVTGVCFDADLTD